jgi:hypothetical protein
MITLYVVRCIFNDARPPGPKQWTLVLKVLEGTGELHVYSEFELAPGTEFQVELAS